jgi:putative FmdB family regulatory protein
MPIYEYKCEDGHVFDVMQRMSDDPLAACQVCGAPVKRVFHPVAVHFKGSGFYNTDYGTRKRSREAKENAGSSDGAEKKSDSKATETKKAESSTASASTSSSSSSSSSD